MHSLQTRYQDVRRHSDAICEPLEDGDFAAQPIVDVSPPKWHLAHSTWFFETFVVKPHIATYKPFHEKFNYLFNSYYEHEGERVKRDLRGNLTRPHMDEIYAYRKHVDAYVDKLIDQGDISDSLAGLIELGLHHEQQHQELLLTDIKYILSQNPLFPVYSEKWKGVQCESQGKTYLSISEGVYEIGHSGEGFCYDNELGRHKVFLEPFEICNRLVTAGEYIEFIEDGGYKDFRHWLMEGWEWTKQQHIQSPDYWHKIDNKWYQYTLRGLQPLDLTRPVTHVSYYEADAFASWKGLRLPTEFEWEVACPHLSFGQVWEWTASAYLPYPRFKKAPGAIGEYNGKFMINQMVLRGGSVASPPHHVRPTYRNFFHPDKRWQYTGIRLVK